MLAGLDPLVILYMPCGGTQDDLLHQLPQHRDQGSSAQPQLCPESEERRPALVPQPAVRTSLACAALRPELACSADEIQEDSVMDKVATVITRYHVPLVLTPLLSPPCSWGLFSSDCSEIRTGTTTSASLGSPSQALTASHCKARLAPADRQGRQLLRAAAFQWQQIIQNQFLDEREKITAGCSQASVLGQHVAVTQLPHGAGRDGVPYCQQANAKADGTFSSSALVPPISEPSDLPGVSSASRRVTVFDLKEKGPHRVQALDASIKSKRNTSSTFNLSRTEVIDCKLEEMAAIEAAASSLLCYVRVIFSHVSQGYVLPYPSMHSIMCVLATEIQGSGVCVPTEVPQQNCTSGKQVLGIQGEVLQPSDHFCGPALDPFQQLHVLLVLRAPELDAVLQDTVGLLGCERTLPAHVQLLVHQYPQVLLRRAALNHIIPQPVLIPGIAPSQVQDLAPGLVEPHEVHTGPLLQLVQVPLDGIPSFWRVSCTTQLGVICKLAEGALNPPVCVIDEDIEQHWSQYGPLRDSTRHRSPSGH
ncbi:hypothetical protein QYF61_023558 [Mycteria americana]|uniref:Uncharacterized protein n=1 Tax=Mycteria americana TaxID=33587 RepID=A0AAN7RXI1_MYCAM|nr:hypothetical protein QYF61_023558 [Mycteria americana]